MLRKHIIYSLYIVITLLVVYIVFNSTYRLSEGFEANDIDMYVISLQHKDRLKNIEEQQTKISKQIQIFDAVKGDKLNMDELIASGIIDPKYKNADKKAMREVGCTMSHLKLIEQIPKRSGYTIIFEDDFNIVSDNFLKDVNDALQKIQEKQVPFDILFLGNLNSIKGAQIVDNVYEVDDEGDLWGTHGYLVNNTRINKILEHISYIDMVIDNKYEVLANTKQLDILVVEPTLVNQQPTVFASTINDFSIETFL